MGGPPPAGVQPALFSNQQLLVRLQTHTLGSAENKLEPACRSLVGPPQKLLKVPIILKKKSGQKWSEKILPSNCNCSSCIWVFSPFSGPAGDRPPPLGDPTRAGTFLARWTPVFLPSRCSTPPSQIHRKIFLPLETAKNLLFFSGFPHLPSRHFFYFCQFFSFLELFTKSRGVF